MKNYQVGKVYSARKLPEIKLGKEQQIVKWNLGTLRCSFVIIEHNWRLDGIFYVHYYTKGGYLYVPNCEYNRKVIVDRKGKEIKVIEKEDV